MTERTVSSRVTNGDGWRNTVLSIRPGRSRTRAKVLVDFEGITVQLDHGRALTFANALVDAYEEGARRG